MDLKRITFDVCSIAKEVGVFIRNESKNFDKSKVEYKGLNALVSYVDKSAEEQIVEKLKQILPEAGFITEEETVENEKKIINWVIDPLDGTTNFTHGIPVYAISIALMDETEVISGVVYEINFDECFYAWKGSESYLNGNVISVSAVSDLKESLVATGFPYYDFGKMDLYLQTLKYFMCNTQGIRRLGSAAVDLVYTACGRFETFFEYGLNSWDVAAGAIIVKQAGGKVSDFSGGENYIFGKEIVAACPGVFQPFQRTVAKYFRN